MRLETTLSRMIEVNVPQEDGTPHDMLPQRLHPVDGVWHWEDWLEFFSRTRESDGRRKGLVEVEL